MGSTAGSGSSSEGPSSSLRRPLPKAAVFVGLVPVPESYTVPNFLSPRLPATPRARSSGGARAGGRDPEGTRGPDVKGGAPRRRPVGPGLPRARTAAATSALPGATDPSPRRRGPPVGPDPGADDARHRSDGGRTLGAARPSPGLGGLVRENGTRRAAGPRPGEEPRSESPEVRTGAARPRRRPKSLRAAATDASRDPTTSEAVRASVGAPAAELKGRSGGRGQARTG